MSKLKSGDILYRIKSSRNEPSIVEPVTVANVGRKYFRVVGGHNDNYNIETLKYTSEMYSQNDKQLYRTEQEPKDKLRFQFLEGIIRNATSGHTRLNLTLSQAERIVEILNEGK